MSKRPDRLAELDVLEGAEVVVWADADDPGRAHARRVAEYLAGKATVRVVESRIAKDADEHLQNGGSVDELVPLDVRGITDPLEPGSSWLPVALPLDAEPLVPDIAGLFFHGLTHIISGKSESGKTMLAYAAMIDEARAGRHVVLVDFEMGLRLVARRFLDALGVSEDELDSLANGPNRRLHVLQPTSSVPVDGIAKLLAAIPEKPSIVVIDAMTSALQMHGLDSNSDTDIEAVYRLLVRPLQASGAAVVVIDHPGKDDSRGDKGSIRKKDVTDIKFVVRRGASYHDGAGSSMIVVDKDRANAFDREAVMRFVLDRPTWRFETTEHVAPSKPTILMERVSRYLEEFGPAVRDEIVKGSLWKDPVRPQSDRHSDRRRVR